MVRMVRDLGHPVGAGGMRLAGHERLAPRRADDLRDFLGLGRDHDFVGQAERLDALQDPHDEGGAAKETERLSGEARGPESGGDDGERGHSELTG
jgi:hypothetical protein